MQMKRVTTLALLAFVGLSTSAAQAGRGGWSFGLSIGAPVYYHPWYPCYPRYYYPPPVYVAPAPIVVQPAPVIQPGPVVQPSYAAPSGEPPLGDPAKVPAADGKQAAIDHHLAQLADRSERVRSESALELGRLKAQRAVDPLAATLAGDPNPAVREAAARALALISSPQSLPALQQAARADADANVRHSAQFAIDVIQTR